MIPIEFVMLLVCLLLWGWAVYLTWERRSLPRLFWLVMTSVWLYIGLMLVLFTFSPPLEILLFFGALPVLAVAYGYRIYDHYRKRHKQKNDDRPKRGAGELETEPR